MITTHGKNHVKRYLAGLVPSVAQSIAFGIGSRAESAGHTSLEFEVNRSDILLTSYDFTNNRIIYKAAVPEEFGGMIYEAALFSLPTNVTASGYGSRILTTFDSITENWVTNGGPSTFTSVGTRIGFDSLTHVPPAGGTSSSVLSDLLFDFSQNSAADKFLFAFNSVNTNAQSVGFRLKTDASNYYTFNFINPASGYQIVEFEKGSAAVTGTPNWGSITQIEVITVSKSTGPAGIELEGIRIEDVDTLNPEYVMVAREVLATPFTKTSGMTEEIEFSLDVFV